MAAYGACWEVLHIPYTFSGVLASAVGTSRRLVCKALYREAGIPCSQEVDLPEGTTVAHFRPGRQAAGGWDSCLSSPPPTVELGVTRHGRLLAQLADAVARAAEGDRVLVETCVEGTE